MGRNLLVQAAISGTGPAVSQQVLADEVTTLLVWSSQRLWWSSAKPEPRQVAKPLARVAAQKANIIRGVLHRPWPASLSRCPKKASQAARKAAATAASGFPTGVPLSKVQALESLMGDLDGDLFLELPTRLAKPKVVPLKNKEDALLRKRNEKDKAEEQLAKIDQRVENLRNELAGLEVQAEESRHRVVVLQSEWQALYDKAGEESVEKADAQPCHAPESDGMDDSDTHSVLQGDADGFPHGVVSQSSKKTPQVSLGC